jgi:hypothetical protein
MVALTEQPESSKAIMSRASSAPLPKVYEDAKIALAECTRIDECAEWANKAQALASYARQADDDTLQKHAMRIQARAIRRCGELLKEFDARPENPKKQSNGDGTLLSQKEAAADAGLSKRQTVAAVRVASIPAKSFEKQVDSDDPPTVTALAEQGKKPRPKPLVDLQGRDPKDFAAATSAQGELSRFAKFIDDCNWPKVIRGSFPDELKDLRKNADRIIQSVTKLRSLL